AGNPYILATDPVGRSIYSTGKRASEGIPSDDFELLITDWSAGMGVDYYYSKNVLTIVRGRAMPGPTVSTLTNNVPTTPIRNWFEAQEPNGNWYLYAISPKAITKVDITAGTPAIKENVGPDVGSPFSAVARLGQPVSAPSSLGPSEKRWFVPGNSYWETAPVFDAASSTAAVSPITFSHTVGTGNNRVLKVDVIRSCFLYDPDATVTYGGVAMTQIGGFGPWPEEGFRRMSTYILVNPPSGANDVVVTLEVAEAGTAGATSWENVDQDDPYGAWMRSGKEGSPATVDIPSAADEVVSDCVWSYMTATITVGPDQTQRWNELNKIGSSSEPGANMITMSWTLTGTPNDWMICAVPLKPVHVIPIYRLTTISLHPTVDVWDEETGVEKGAMHFQELPSGKIARLVSDMGGVSRARSEVSLLAAGANLEIDNNWGDDFPVASQAYRPISLVAYDELLVIGKQNGWFAAVEKEDGTLQWRELLPDEEYLDEGDIKDYTFHAGLHWHGRLMLPGINFWRHNLSSALPVGPDSIPGNIGDEPNLADQIRFGRIPTAAHGGEWQYDPYNLPGGGFYIMAARERRYGERGETELVWHPIIHRSAGKCQGVHKQKHGSGAPRLWWGEGTYGGDLAYISLAADGGPFKPGASYGDANADGTMYGLEYLFESLVLLREMKLEIEEGNNELSWQAQVQRDGGSVEDVGSAITSTGPIFWTARSNDKCRRARFPFKWIGSVSYDPSGNRTRVRKQAMYGSYLPDVSDVIVCTVDMKATSASRGVSEQELRAELDSVTKSGAEEFTDLHEISYDVLVDEVMEGSAPHVDGVEGKHLVGLRMRVLRYS
ncbi:hypothetical protein LCGC14_1554330, partial [marine sediment metagenome]